MTRKQAIIQAIQALSAQEGNEQAIALLQDIYDEMPLIHWSDKSIRDTIEQFIVDQGRVPTVSDFRKKGMPPHPVFKQKYGITLSEWLAIHYPQPKKNLEKEKREETEKFLVAYHELLPKSAKFFDQHRPEGVKCWATIAKYHGCSNWRSLLETLSLTARSNGKDNHNNVAFNITVFHDLFDDIDQKIYL